MVMRKRGRLIVSVIICFLYTSVYVPYPTQHAYADDEFDGMIDKYQAYLSGYPFTGYDPEDPFMAEQIERIDAVAANWHEQMNEDNTWDDLQCESKESTISLSRIFYRLNEMATAWATYGSTFFDDDQLLADTIAGLDWVVANRYNASITYTGQAPYGSSFHWEIAIPRSFLKTIYLLYDELDSVRIASYTAAIQNFTPHSVTDVNNTLMTGANRAMKAQVCILNAILMKDGDWIEDTIEELDDDAGKVFNYQDQDSGSGTGDGFYSDGSYIMHTYFPYAGGYGLDHLEFMIQLIWILDGTSYSFDYDNSASKHSRALNWFKDSFEPNMFAGQMFESVRGRVSSRPTGNGTAFRVIDALILLTELEHNSDAELQKRIIKEHVTGNAIANSYYRYASLYNLQTAKALVNDVNVTAYQEPAGNFVYHNQARVVHRRDDWAFNIAMHTVDLGAESGLSRIRAKESLNNENTEAWYTSDGMTYLYMDSTDYAYHFFPTVDRHRLPGITVDRDLNRPDNAQYGGALPDNNTWVGGVSNGEFGAAGMEFQQHNYSSMDVNAKKSWFMFDDEVVALGADINSTSGRPIETIIENRFLNPAGDNLLTIDGVSKPTSPGWNETINSVHWAHLEGTGGYIFPTGLDLHFLREERTGEDYEINQYAPFPGNDEFDSAIKAGHWIVMNEDGEHYSLNDNDNSELEIETRALDGDQIKNLFVAAAPGADFYVTAKLEFVPEENGQEAGLILYLDEENYVGVSRVRTGGTNKIRVSNVSDGSNTGNDYTDSYNNTVYLKMKKTGTDYAVFASNEDDENSWGTALASVVNPTIAENPSNDQLMMGMYAHSGASGTETATAAFDYFHYKYTKNYLTIWKGHGLYPEKASYAYALLPAATLAETEDYTESPEFIILENSEDAQGVKETTLNAVAVNFWKDQDDHVDIIRSNKKASVMTKITGNQIEIAVSDPTRMNEGTIGLEIYKTALSLVSKDPEITENISGSTILLSVDVDGSRGKTFKAVFTLDSGNPALPELQLPYAVSDDFDAMATGFAPTGWTANTSGGTVTVEEVPDSTDKSLKVNDTDSGEYTDATKTFDPVGGLVTVEFRASPAQANKLMGISYLYDHSNVIAGSLQFFNDGTIRAHDGANLTVLQNYAGNTWYDFKLVLDTETDRYDIYIDGILKADQYQLRNDVSDIAKIMFHFNASWTGVLYVDDVRIYETTARKPLQPTADANTRDGTSYADTNFGSSSNLIVKLTAVPDNGANRQSYLKFDLNGLKSKEVRRAKLRLFANNVGNVADMTIHVYETVPGWEESSITWNNAPVAGDLITGFELIADTPGWYEADLTEFVNEHTDEGIVSMMLAMDDADKSNNSQVAFNSNESALWKPELVYEPAPPEHFLPVEDTYIRSGIYADNHFGHLEQLVLKESEPVDYDRKIYMTFDFGALEEDGISRAKLKLFPYLAGSDGYKVVKVYAVADESWSENSLTWNNAPSYSELLNTFDVGNVAGISAEVDITDYVNAHMNDKKLSLALVLESLESDHSNIAFRSSEYHENSPILEIYK